MNENTLKKLKWKVKEKKAKAFKRKQVKRERAKWVRLTRTLYVEPLASRAPTTKEVRIFEQEQKSRELEKELEAILNFSRRTTIFTIAPTPHVIVILNSKEEVEILFQPIAKK